MSRRSKDLNFLALVSIVIGSQLGSSAFIVPATLAPFGAVGLFGWVVSVAGAISLALVFSDLSSHLPKNGGPHVYVSEAFGKTAGFFTAWIYWIISWSSNSVLLVTTMIYLQILTGELTSIQMVSIEVAVLFLITYINIVGIKFSGTLETILTFMKIVPLLFLPAIFFMFFNPEYFKFSLSDISSDSIVTISQTALLTFWGFIGVECATTPAEKVVNPKRTIPRAIIIGTSCVAMIYIMNTVSVFGAVGFEALEKTNAPYAVVMEKIYCHVSNVSISIMAIIVCIGTLNAWTLTGGQIAYGAYCDGLFPKLFGKTNRAGAPVAALLISAVGIIPFLIIEQMDCWRSGLEKLIDLLVSVFLFVYLACCISYLKLLNKWKKTRKEKVRAHILAQVSIIFCIFVLSQDLLSSFLVLGIFLMLGVPILLRHKKTMKFGN